MDSIKGRCEGQSPEAIPRAHWHAEPGGLLRFARNIHDFFRILNGFSSLCALAENLAQKIRIVRDDAFRPEVDRHFHFLYHVHGPEVDLYPRLPGLRDQVGEEKGKVDGDLEGARPDGIVRGDVRVEEQEPCDLDGAGACGNIRREVPHPRQRGVARRGEQDLLLHAVRIDQVHHLSLDLGVFLLDLDVEPLGWKPLERLLQRGDPHASVSVRVGRPAVGREPVAGIQGLHLIKSHAVHQPVALRGPIDRVVVEHDDHPIRGAANVRLDDRRPRPEPDLERNEGVLGGDAAASLVSYVSHALPVEVVDLARMGRSAAVAGREEQ